ncbi:MAG: hypothetical protein ACTSYG_08525 [Candidatus Heimdallarchaeota archaeon]
MNEMEVTNKKLKDIIKKMRKLTRIGQRPKLISRIVEHKLKYFIAWGDKYEQKFENS